MLVAARSVPKGGERNMNWRLKPNVTLALERSLLKESGGMLLTGHQQIWWWPPLGLLWSLLSVYVPLLPVWSLLLPFYCSPDMRSPFYHPPLLRGRDTSIHHAWVGGLPWFQGSLRPPEAPQCLSLNGRTWRNMKQRTPPRWDLRRGCSPAPNSHE